MRRKSPRSNRSLRMLLRLEADGKLLSATRRAARGKADSLGREFAVPSAKECNHKCREHGSAPGDEPTRELRRANYNELPGSRQITVAVSDTA